MLKVAHCESNVWCGMSIAVVHPQLPTSRPCPDAISAQPAMSKLSCNASLLVKTIESSFQIQTDWTILILSNESNVQYKPAVRLVYSITKNTNDLNLLFASGMPCQWTHLRLSWSNLGWQLVRYPLPTGTVSNSLQREGEVSLQRSKIPTALPDALSLRDGKTCQCTRLILAYETC